MNRSSAGIDIRIHLVQANRVAIGLMLDRAVTGGVERSLPVVIIADTRDRVGRALAEAATARSTLDIADEAERVSERGEVPTAIIIVSINVARELFMDSHPSVAKGLDRLPRPGCVRCVSIAGGAATLIHVDIRPMAPIANA